MLHRDGEDAVGGGGSAGLVPWEIQAMRPLARGPRAAPAVHRACVFIRGKDEPSPVSRGPHGGAARAGSGPCPVPGVRVRGSRQRERVRVLKGTRRHPELVMTLLCYLYAVFLARLLKRGARVSVTDLTSAF